MKRGDGVESGPHPGKKGQTDQEIDPDGTPPSDFAIGGRMLFIILATYCLPCLVGYKYGCILVYQQSINGFQGSKKGPVASPVLSPV